MALLLLQQSGQPNPPLKMHRLPASLRGTCASLSEFFVEVDDEEPVNGFHEGARRQEQRRHNQNPFDVAVRP